jgi:hypothetical protein
MIKVNYDPKTTLVKGYYPDSINYNSIPKPFIEIEENEQDNSKQMCVIDGIYQEYVKPIEQQFQEAKTSKIYETKNACESFRTTPLTVDNKIYKATDNAKLKFWSLVNGSLVSDFPIIWLEADDVSFVSLSKVQATALYDAFEAQDRSAYQQRKNYLDQINSCTTLEQVKAININFK